MVASLVCISSCVVQCISCGNVVILNELHMFDWQLICQITIKYKIHEIKILILEGAYFMC